MGEYADYYVNEIYDPYWEDDEGALIGMPIPLDRNNKVCRCCGKNGLHWKQVNNKWLLHSSDGIHKCEKNLYNPKLIKD